MTTKIIGLTSSQRAALSLAIAEFGALAPVKDGITFAEWSQSPLEVHASFEAAVERMAAAHGRRGHPVASVHGVRRRIWAEHKQQLWKEAPDGSA